MNDSVSEHAKCAFWAAEMENAYTRHKEKARFLMNRVRKNESKFC